MHVLLIEDDLKMAGFVIKGLTEAGFAVDHAADGMDGLQKCLTNSYNIGIFDLMLPKLNGLEIIGRIREQRIQMPVLILSARQTIDDRVAGLQRGGDDYLTKPFSFSELLARLQALLRRSHALTESAQLQYEELNLDLLTRKVERRGKEIELQPKELALLEYLMRNRERIVSKTMIIERVWEYNFDPHTNIVEARMSKLRDKIDKGFEYPLIHTVRGLGYVLKKKQ